MYEVNPNRNSYVGCNAGKLECCCCCCCFKLLVAGLGLFWGSNEQRCRPLVLVVQGAPKNASHFFLKGVNPGNQNWSFFSSCFLVFPWHEMVLKNCNQINLFTSPFVVILQSTTNKNMYFEWCVLVRTSWLQIRNCERFCHLRCRLRYNFCCLQFEITFFPVLIYFKHV